MQGELKNLTWKSVYSVQITFEGVATPEHRVQMYVAISITIS